MFRLINTVLPMHGDRLYASERSTQAAYASSVSDVSTHQTWQQSLMEAHNEDRILQLLGANSADNISQHGIDTYVIHAYIHEQHHTPFTSLASLIGSPLTISYETPNGMAYRHLHIIAIRQIDHEGSYGYYRLLAQPITYQLHTHQCSHVDIQTDVVTMTAERLSEVDVSIIDDTNQSWTPARMTQWQQSDWAHICERLSRQGLSAYLRHNNTSEHSPPTLVITNAEPTEDNTISRNLGAIRYHQALHDRVQAPVLSLNQSVHVIPAHVYADRFDVTGVTHSRQQTTSAPIYDTSVVSSGLTIDTPAAFAPVIDTHSVDDAQILTDANHTQHHHYNALSVVNDLAVADTFHLTGHDSLNHHYRVTHITHLARNSLAHITGLTLSTRHQQRHASMLDAGSHLTQLRLINADTPWVGALYTKPYVPAVTGLTEAQDDSDSRNHMTPTRMAVMDASAQPIHRLEAQAGASYGTHFTHRADDQTLIQSIGDSEHLINAGSLLSETRPSLFATENEQAIESGYRHQDSGALTEWITDHRDTQAYSQWQVKGSTTSQVKMGIIDPATDSTAKRDGIQVTTDAQISVKTGNALSLSTYPQTHLQSGEHDYQHHTPTLTQTALGGQHLTELLTQLAKGLGKTVNDHSDIKTQLETISEEQQTKTHQETPFTLIDSAADISYSSTETLITRTMGEMLSTTQGDYILTSGENYSQVSNEAMTMVADGSISMTNAKDNILLSAHTGKLEATAKQDVNIASSTQAVEVMANDKITLTAGGASIVLEGANITISANQFTEKAGKHSKAGGGMDGLG
ncbi:DUF2345 domain-containing protein, partial [Psychrobacter sp. bablab_jr012]|uniref:DUF2345 domain-containing protein n=1 Tax=Psychrobacter sp. bablab_jr012 TaxID=2755061 RepID=UPI0018F32BD0